MHFIWLLPALKEFPHLRHVIGIFAELQFHTFISFETLMKKCERSGLTLAIGDN